MLTVIIDESFIVSMKWPSPAYREYFEFVATVLATLAILQYTGVFFENPGAIDPFYLISIGLLIPISTYLLTVIQENIAWIPQWNRMIRGNK